MNAKKWIKIFSIIPLLIISIVGGINFMVDPLWNFSHTNALNKKQLTINERQQKTNYVYFNGLDTYDGILLGSSRATYIDQNEFYGMNIYNYAIESMYPFEYEGYLEFAKVSKGKEFKQIIIGVDFFNSKVYTESGFKHPSHYIEKTKSLFYRYKILLSIDLFKRSLKNIACNIFDHPIKYYTRDNVKIRGRFSEEKRVKRYKKFLKIHTKSFMGDNYRWNDEYIHILKRLKKENPNSKFIIFTSAISADLLASIIKNGDRMEEFENWLKVLIEVFGEIHHFMTINSITTNLQNYADDDHLYPDIANLVANKLSGKENSDIPKDFGIIINKENISTYMKLFKEQLKNYKTPLNLKLHE